MELLEVFVPPLSSLILHVERQKVAVAVIKQVHFLAVATGGPDAGDAPLCRVVRPRFTVSVTTCQNAEFAAASGVTHFPGHGPLGALSWCGRGPSRAHRQLTAVL